MNFEIKSTFKYLHKTRGFFRHHFVAILVLSVNFSIAVAGAILYLGNFVIPATIVSLPEGNLYLIAVKAAIVLKCATSAAAILHLSVRGRKAQVWKRAILRTQWPKDAFNLQWASAYRLRTKKSIIQNH